MAKVVPSDRMLYLSTPTELLYCTVVCYMAVALIISIVVSTLLRCTPYETW